MLMNYRSLIYCADSLAPEEQLEKIKKTKEKERKFESKLSSAIK